MKRSLALLLCFICAPAGGALARDTSLDPELARQRISEARTAAAEDRNGDAASLYVDALLCDMRLVGEIAAEAAYQMLWDEQAEYAAFHFRRYLARHPGEDQRTTRRGLALAYSWAGYQGKAVTLYRELVAEDPTDAEAKLGLGRSLLWDNRLREGFSVLREVETHNDQTTAAGRESRRFLLQVLDEYPTPLEVRTDFSRDTDDLRITRLSAIARFTAGNVLWQVAPGYAWYRQERRPSVDAPRLAAGLVAPLAHDWNLHAYGWLDRYQGDLASLPWTRVGGDLWLTWIATARLRLDAGAASQVVETYDALAKRLHLEQANLSADWRLWRRWTFSAVGSAGWYSDQNFRTRGTVRLDWHREGTWDLVLGPVLMYMDYRDPYPGGYWAPDWVRNGSLRAILRTQKGRWRLRIDGSYGAETELGSDTIGVGAGSLHVGFRFAPAWLLSGEVGHSRSRFTSDSCYQRTFGSVAVRAFY